METISFSRRLFYVTIKQEVETTERGKRERGGGEGRG
jgi:hypothetical protein